MLNFENVQEEYTLIEPGTYETVLTAEWKEVNGKKTINCKYFIRDDVDQKFQGRIVFDTIWESKNKPGEFTPTKISKILKTVPNGKLEFATYDDVIQYINGLPMRVDVAIDPADPNNANSKDRNVIKWDSWRTTLKPVVQTESPFKDIKTSVDLSADMLPF